VATYQLSWRPQLRRKLRDMPVSLRGEIAAIILSLKEDPYPPTSAPLRRDLSQLRKIPVDGWRIIYQVKDADRIVVIREIRPRDANTYLNL
jgi:mRNA-degrading endonuclease RelE of RelBE toxin-antitoxin system